MKIKKMNNGVMINGNSKIIEKKNYCIFYFITFSLLNRVKNIKKKKEMK